MLKPIPQPAAEPETKSKHFEPTRHQRQRNGDDR
jgi:hypothetical protein